MRIFSGQRKCLNFFYFKPVFQIDQRVPEWFLICRSWLQGGSTKLSWHNHQYGKVTKWWCWLCSIISGSIFLQWVALGWRQDIPKPNRWKTNFGWSFFLTSGWRRRSLRAAKIWSLSSRGSRKGSRRWPSVFPFIWFHSNIYNWFPRWWCTSRSTAKTSSTWFSSTLYISFHIYLTLYPF